MKRKKIIILVVLMMFCLMSCGEKNGKDNSNKENVINGNINNESTIVKKDDWIYYALGNSIYRCREDISEKEEIINMNGEAEYITIHDEYIFFVCDGLYVARTDGSECKLLIDEDMEGTYVVDNWLHYDSKYRVNLDSFEVEQIYNSNSRSSFGINIEDDWLYFSELNSEGSYKTVSRMRLDGSNKEDVYTGLVRQLVAYDKWIYLYDEREATLYKMSLDGSNKKKLVDNINVGDLNIHDNWIYFYGYDGSFYKLTTDGENLQRLSHNLHGLHFIDDCIYYREEFGGKNVGIYRIKIDGTEEIFAER